MAKVTLGQLKFCLAVIMTKSDYVTVRTYMIQTYSTTHGRAHCLDGNLIIKGGEEILAGCTTMQKHTGGQYEWSTDGENGEGVRFVKAPLQV